MGEQRKHVFAVLQKLDNSLTFLSQVVIIFASLFTFLHKLLIKHSNNQM